MDTGELYNLSGWVITNLEAIQQKYHSLADILDHNATQPSKQPVKEQLSSLISAVKAMPLDELSMQQRHLLVKIGIDQLIGDQGAVYVKRVVTESNFDPATSAKDIRSAEQTLNTSMNKFQQIKQSLDDAGLSFETDKQIDKERYVVKLTFKDDAALTDVVRLKHWSSDWHEILRGMSLWVDEAPESTKIVGASNGSIILTLATTYGVVKIFALIAREVTNTLLTAVQLADTIEDLRAKRFLNREIEKSLRQQQKQNESEGVQKSLDAIKTANLVDGGIDGEKETALRRSIEKFYNFSNKGGDVDFISPPTDGGTTDEESKEEAVDVALIISEISRLRSDIRLLEYKRDGSADD
jgi:hypothetical protein